MRIFLTGAQGTGKSTLVNCISEVFPTLKKRDSMSKKFMNDIEDQTTDDFQKKISLYCLNMYVNGRNFISSRSYFDSIAYPTVNDKVKWEKLIEMNRSYKSYMFQDDCYYFYLPIEFRISNRGNNLRLVDPFYQKKVDTIIRNEINHTDFEHIYTITGNVDERLHKIISILFSPALEEGIKIDEAAYDDAMIDPKYK